ncbi:type II toxin-antitoxin system VapC family toxin [Paraburkholderia aspalathi]|nr:hypothetical protein [Paraburkholderia aspalathi]MBK3780369.1 type II toxin-antitoxin system VapC family toxin [Paraburkholderia aspalathi]
MRDMEKFKRDQREGQFASRRVAASKTFETSIISSAISRAMRRGRITPETARRCAQNWVNDLNARPKNMVWSRVASRELLEVALLRRRGLYSHARYALNTVRIANQRSKPTAV